MRKLIVGVLNAACVALSYTSVAFVIVVLALALIAVAPLLIAGLVLHVARLGLEPGGGARVKESARFVAKLKEEINAAALRAASTTPPSAVRNAFDRERLGDGY